MIDLLIVEEFWLIVGVDLVFCEVCGSVVGFDDMFVEEVIGLVVLVVLVGFLVFLEIILGFVFIGV